MFIEKKIKQQFRKQLNSFSLPTDKIHAKRKDGGLQLQKLKEIQTTAQASLLIDRILNGQPSPAQKIIQNILDRTSPANTHPLTPLHYHPHNKNLTPAIQSTIQILEEQGIQIIDTEENPIALKNAIPDTMLEYKKDFPNMTTENIPQTIQCNLIPIYIELLKKHTPIGNRPNPNIQPAPPSTETKTIYTDGSKKTKKKKKKGKKTKKRERNPNKKEVAAAITYQNAKERNIRFKPVGEQTNNNAELQACELALQGEDPSTPIRIVTDSQQARDNIQNLIEGKEISHKASNYATLKRIQVIIQKRQHANSKTKIEHIYSHTEKKTNPETNGIQQAKNWKKKISDKIKEIGWEKYQQYTKGNRKADKLASSNKKRIKFKGEGPATGARRYLLLKKTKKGKNRWIYESAKYHIKTQTDKKTKQLTLFNEVSRIPNAELINFKASNKLYLSSTLPSNIKSFAIRARSDQIHTNSKIFKKDEDKQECPYCPGERETPEHHLGACHHLNIHYKRIQNEIKRIYKKHKIPTTLASDWGNPKYHDLPWVWALGYIPKKIIRRIKKKTSKSAQEATRIASKISKIIIGATYKRYLMRWKHHPPQKKTNSTDRSS